MLLLQAHYCMQSKYNQPCMSILSSVTETANQFLTCRHPNREQILKDLYEHLHKHQLHHIISNIFHDLLAFRLYQGWQAPTDLLMHHLPTDLQVLYDKQQYLGQWHHTTDTSLPPGSHPLRHITYKLMEWCTMPNVLHWFGKQSSKSGISKTNVSIQAIMNKKIAANYRQMWIRYPQSQTGPYPPRLGCTSQPRSDTHTTHQMH